MPTSDAARTVVESGQPGTGLIMEGREGGFATANLYVEQGDKVFFFQGAPLLCESTAPMMRTLVEDYQELELEERIVNGSKIQAPKDGRWFFEGPFQRSDTKNANNRVYPKAIWSKWVGDEKSSVQEKVKSGGMIGHFEHPENGRTWGPKGAIITRQLSLDNKGVVRGVGEILDGTPDGAILVEYTLKGVRWGVSSRGTGTVGTDGVVGDDYVVETFDAVMNPSTPGAYATVTTQESVFEVTYPETRILSEAVTDLAAVATDVQSPVQRLLDVKAHFDRVYRAQAEGKISLASAVELGQKLADAVAQVGASVTANRVSASDVLAEADMTGLDTVELDENYENAISQLQANLEAKRLQLESTENRLERTRTDLQRARAQVDEYRGKIRDMSAALKEAERDESEMRELLEQAKSALETSESRRAIASEAAARVTADTSRVEENVSPVKPVDRPRGITETSAVPRRHTLPVGEVVSDNFDTAGAFEDRLDESDDGTESSKPTGALAVAAQAVEGMRARSLAKPE